MKDDFFDWLFSDGVVGALVMVPCIAFGIWFVLMISLTALTQNRCLGYGYPSHRVALDLSRYCVARENQTDVVIPLSEAEP